MDKFHCNVVQNGIVIEPSKFSAFITKIKIRQNRLIITNDKNKQIST